MSLSGGVSELHTPPLSVVLALQRALTRKSIPSAVGGSGLLASLGLVATVNDWDLVADAEPAEIESTLNELQLSYTCGTQSGVFRTLAIFTIEAGDHQIDVLVGFALASLNGTVYIPARSSHVWRGLQMAEAWDWRLAYRLMGREDRARLLEQHLQ